MTTAAHQAPHRRLALPALLPGPRRLPVLTTPRVRRGLARRGRPALTGAGFGAVVGVLLAGGGMDPVAALTAGTGFGLAAGLLVPAPAPGAPAGGSPGR